MKTDLVKAIHFLHQKGYAPATSSNYSIKLSENTNFWVSESGIDKGEFRIENLIPVNQSGQPINDPRTTSAETDLHTTLYQLYPKSGCILHTHSVLGTILSQKKQKNADILIQNGILLENYELLKAFEGIKTHETAVFIPIFENTQDIPSLSAKIRAYHAENTDMRAFLIAGHGMYTWASTVAAAKRQVETIEFLLECEYRKELLNGTSIL